MNPRRWFARSPKAVEPAAENTGGDDAELIAALRAGDEAAFARLVDEYHASMVRLATSYVPSYAVAEEVAQEAWLGVLKGLDRFEGRSSLKTWIFRIVVNIARTRGERESRSTPFSSFAPAGDESPTVDPERFTDEGFWLPGKAPATWERSPEDLVVSGEITQVVTNAIAVLPPSQREVVRLRDVEGWSSDEVCNVLGLTETNQRVLLHRGRARVRRVLAEYLGDAS